MYFAGRDQVPSRSLENNSVTGCINTDWLFHALRDIIVKEHFNGGSMWKRKGLRTVAVESGAAESVAAAAWIRFCS